MKNPKFIVFEGLDACGKSTISTEFARQHQIQLMGALPPKIKSWLPKIAATNLPEATFSYFTLCNLLRAQEIKEKLAHGESVVLDRFLYTSYSYHKALLKDAMPEEIKKIYRFQDLPKPDLLVYLDVPQMVRAKRIKGRKGDLQWYGDQVSLEHDLTEVYFDLFQTLDVNPLRIDNHTNSVEETLSIVNNHFQKIQMVS
jgi:deoxyguanosine kinase